MHARLAHLGQGNRQDDQNDRDDDQQLNERKAALPGAALA
jgi:hypothetical protein